MKHSLRTAIAAALLAASGSFAATATAAPPLNYDQEIVSQFDSANSMETIRHLAVDIGPRRSGTPQEREGAEYLKGILDGLGFQTEIYSFPINGNRAVAQVKSPNATLPNGPNWQFSSSTNGVQTGVDHPMTGDVVYAGAGDSADDFPAGSAGKIILMDQGGSTDERTAQVANAIAAGAIAVVLGNTGISGSGIPSAPSTTVRLADDVAIPVMGAGRSHLDWMKELLAAGTLTFSFTTENYINPMRSVVIGRRFAVGDTDGTKAPIVMVGAHIDSVLGAPGAHDDASGNGVSMEIARVVSQLPLDKEIRIGGFGGEEDGLTGSRAYVATLPEEERARFVGEWQMDMVGTPYEPARLWALTPDGRSNFVVDEAYKAADRFGFDGLDNCKLGQSDHQAFFDVGIPSALFIWLDYHKPVAPDTCESIRRGQYTTEPEYHRPMDGMNNVSPERLQTTLDVVGGAFAHNAMNRVDVTVSNGAQPAEGAVVTGDCGDGERNFGTTDASGYLEVRVPHATCDFDVASGDLTAAADDFA
ncbi:MAG TPA: M28 family peptidase, partial [Solirubrobacter sp.]|nr:M28 family peptidase [Solirubrobacter sp.]